MPERPEYLVLYQAMIDDAIIAWDRLTEVIHSAIACIVEQWQRALFAVYLSRWLPPGPVSFLARHWPIRLMPDMTDWSFMGQIDEESVDDLDGTRCGPLD